MSRIIYCIFLKQYSEGLDSNVYPGILGKRIYENISKKAWFQWLKKQTILINENKLSMINSEDRIMLEKEMIKFLFKHSNDMK